MNVEIDLAGPDRLLDLRNGGQVANRREIPDIAAIARLFGRVLIRIIDIINDLTYVGNVV